MAQKKIAPLRYWRRQISHSGPTTSKGNAAVLIRYAAAPSMPVVSAGRGHARGGGVSDQDSRIALARCGSAMANLATPISERRDLFLRHAPGGCSVDALGRPSHDWRARYRLAV